MTTKRILNPIDFMLMDVHRAMSDEEISKFAPQAVVDKTDEHHVNTQPTGVTKYEQPRKR